MASNQNPFVFDTILATAFRKGLSSRQTVSACNWFRTKAKALGKDITPESLMGEVERYRTSITYGRLYHFFYDPKHKATLPYYDTFPLVFPIDYKQNGFLGINLHYLPLRMRAYLMDALFENLNNSRFDESTRILTNYAVLNSASKYKWFRPTIKHYLWGHVRSRFLRIEVYEWNIALFLPTERFQKMNKENVWIDSKDIIDSYEETVIG